MGKQPNFIVVTRGLKTGVFQNWLEAEEYVDPVRGQAKFQGFPTQEQANQVYQSALARGRVKILTLAPSLGAPSPTSQSETPAEPSSSPRTPSQDGHPNLFNEPSKQESTSPVISPAKKVSISYPNDRKNAYFVPKEMRRSHSALVQASPRGSPPVRREISGSPGSIKPSLQSSHSSTGSVETALTSLSLHEVENVDQFPRRTKISPQNMLQLSPIMSPQLSTTEEVYSMSNQRSSPHSARASPLKKSSSQLSSSSASPAQSPRRSDKQTNGHLLVEVAESPRLNQHYLQSTSSSHASPRSSAKRSPKKAGANNSDYSPIPGPSFSTGIPDFRSPLKKANLEADFYDSCSSTGRPSPQASRSQAFAAFV